MPSKQVQLYQGKSVHAHNNIYAPKRPFSNPRELKIRTKIFLLTKKTLAKLD